MLRCIGIFAASKIRTERLFFCRLTFSLSANKSVDGFYLHLSPTDAASLLVACAFNAAFPLFAFAAQKNAILQSEFRRSGGFVSFWLHFCFRKLVYFSFLFVNEVECLLQAIRWTPLLRSRTHS